MTLPTFQNLASESGSIRDYDSLVGAFWHFDRYPSEVNADVLLGVARRCGYAGVEFSSGNDPVSDLVAWAVRRVAAYRKLMSNLTPALVMIEAYEGSASNMQGAE